MRIFSQFNTKPSIILSFPHSLNCSAPVLRFVLSSEILCIVYFTFAYFIFSSVAVTKVCRYFFYFISQAFLLVDGYLAAAGTDQAHLIARSSFCHVIALLVLVLSLQKLIELY